MLLLITSLNVNNFLGQNEWTTLKGNDQEKNRIWNQYEGFYFNYIENHIVHEDDIIILHEVPYVKEQAYTTEAAK